MDDLEPSTTHFYPRSPCGERLQSPGNLPLCTRFLSTLSLRRATSDFNKAVKQMAFLSTLSLRRATVGVAQGAIAGNISIHALLAESDQLAACDESIMFVFLSTLSLRRATILSYSEVIAEIRFLSTLSLRRATSGIRRLLHGSESISIHALLAESDQSIVWLCSWTLNFYPRSPCGERRLCCLLQSCCCYFYPRSPCGERHRDGATSGCAG